ncbi:hypothetical protein K432DRAFT_68336 [Lepidopterella palustris CBS 459.81]|uniref:Uncharacterized protein n=1 Tax=Lepidopterella palustris CBS 459.81 TaxID=1314670 RepID=A0A8E2JEV5_9PEZI|nr:hypothetical protein K432DRAFT_68336 [Lepidopterella palustris CBS 459.81]
MHYRGYICNTISHFQYWYLDIRGITRQSTLLFPSQEYGICLAMAQTPLLYALRPGTRSFALRYLYCITAFNPHRYLLAPLIVHPLNSHSNIIPTSTNHSRWIKSRNLAASVLKRNRTRCPSLRTPHISFLSPSASFLFTHIFFFFAITGKMDHLKFLRNPARGMGLFDHAPVIRCNLIFTWIHDSRPSTPFNPPGLRSFQAPTWSDFAWLHPRTIPPNAHASMTYSNRHQPFCQA